MAGKSKKPNTKDKRGGARKGTGPKPRVSIPKDAIDKTIDKILEWEKRTGKHIDDILLEFAYGEVEELKLTPRDRLAAIDMIKKYTIPKMSEKDVNIKTDGPAIALPPVRNDPAKIIPIDGGKKG